MGVAVFQDNFFYENRQPVSFGSVGCSLPTLILNTNDLILDNVKSSPSFHPAVSFVSCGLLSVWWWWLNKILHFDVVKFIQLPSEGCVFWIVLRLPFSPQQHKDIPLVFFLLTPYFCRPSHWVRPWIRQVFPFLCNEGGSFIFLSIVSYILHTSSQTNHPFPADL